MKVKVSELQGVSLNWAVAKCEGQEDPIYRHAPSPGDRDYEEGKDYSRHFYVSGPMKMGPYKPSTRWDQGGPIIEREFIAVFSVETRPFEGEWAADDHRHQQCGEIDDQGSYGFSFGENCMRGPTPLIAAMRCYVSSKMGDEVEIPDELTGTP